MAIISSAVGSDAAAVLRGRATWWRRRRFGGIGVPSARRSSSIARRGLVGVSCAARADLPGVEGCDERVPMAAAAVTGGLRAPARAACGINAASRTRQAAEAASGGSSSRGIGAGAPRSSSSRGADACLLVDGWRRACVGVPHGGPAPAGGWS